MEGFEGFVCVLGSSSDFHPAYRLPSHVICAVCFRCSDSEERKAEDAPILTSRS